MVQAIHPEGNINVNECLYCLHCQEVYFDDHACPVMIQKRLKRERRSSRAAKTEYKEVSAITTELNKTGSYKVSDE
jgi:polyferredoxin